MTLKAVFAALKSGQSIQKIDLRHQNITAADLEKLVGLIKHHATLKILDLSYSNFGAKAVQYLAELLKANQALTALHVSGNGIDDKGVQSLCEALMHHKTLTTLTLGLNRISNEGAQYVGKLLKVNRVLESLDFSEHDIDDTGIQYITEALKVNSTLRHLRLFELKIGPQGARYFSEVLRRNKTLRILDLHANNIGAVGACSLSEALKVNHTLIKLDVGANRIGNTGAKALRDMLTTNTTLYSGFGYLGMELHPNALYRIHASTDEGIRTLIGRNQSIQQFVEVAEEAMEKLTAFTSGLPKNKTEIQTVNKQSQCIVDCINAICELMPTAIQIVSLGVAYDKIMLTLALLNRDKTTAMQHYRELPLSAQTAPGVLNAFAEYYYTQSAPTRRDWKRVLSCLVTATPNGFCLYKAKRNMMKVRSALTQLLLKKKAAPSSTFLSIYEELEEKSSQQKVTTEEGAQQVLLALAQERGYLVDPHTALLGSQTTLSSLQSTLVFYAAVNNIPPDATTSETLSNTPSP